MKKLLALALLSLATFGFASKDDTYSFSILNYALVDISVVGEYCSTTDINSCDPSKPIGTHSIDAWMTGFLIVPAYEGSHIYLVTQMTDPNGNTFPLTGCMSVNSSTLKVVKDVTNNTYKCD
jgi:hypothetical protein